MLAIDKGGVPWREGGKQAEEVADITSPSAPETKTSRGGPITKPTQGQQAKKIENMSRGNFAIQFERDGYMKGWVLRSLFLQ